MGIHVNAQYLLDISNMEKSQRYTLQKRFTQSRGLVHLARAHHAHPEVKAYAKPPEAVMKTMCAVMTVMEKTPSWGQAWLSGGCFLQRSMASNVWKRQE